jgi:hypothetical protein
MNQLYSTASFLLISICLCLSPSAQAVSKNDTVDHAFRLYQAGFAVGDNTGATGATDEPQPGEIGDGRTLWWRWEGGTSRILTLQGLDEKSDFILSIYERSPEGELTELQQITSLGGSPGSLRVDDFFEGQDLWIAVDSVGSSTGGRFYFSIDQAPVIFAPLQVRAKPGQSIEVPALISGFPGEIRLDGDSEGFYYDRVARVIRGTIPKDYHSDRRIEIVASNEFGYVDASLSIIPDDAQPVLTSPASATGFVGQAFEYALEFDRGAGITPDYVNIESLPDGFVAVLEDGIWKVRGVPGHSGVANFQVSAFDSDRDGPDTRARVTLNFVDTDALHIRPGIISPTSAKAQVGQPFAYQIETTFPASEFQVFGLPPGLSLDSTGLISGSPENEVPRIQVIAENQFGLKSENTLELDFLSPSAPTIEIAPLIIAYANVPMTETIRTSGIDSLTVTNLPNGLSYDPISRTISGVPLQTGLWDTEFHLEGTGSSNAQFTVQFEVLASDGLLHIVSPAQVRGEVGVFLEHPLEFAPFAPNMETPVNILNLPRGLQYDHQSHTIFGTPRDSGRQSVLIGVDGNRISLQFIIGEPSQPPRFTNAAQAFGRQDAFFYFALNASGDPTYSIESGTLPPGISLNNSTGVLTGIPTGTPNEPELFDVIIRAENRFGVRSTAKLEIYIAASDFDDKAIILSPGQLSAEVGETFVYSIAASGGTFEAFDTVGLPSDFFFDPQDGIIYGSRDTPMASSFIVRQGNAEATVLLNIWEPTESTPPPLVTSAPSTIGELEAPFDFQISLSDYPEGSTVRFTKDSGWPDSLTLNESSGRISGTLGMDWPPQIGFSVALNGRVEAQDELSIVRALQDAPIALNSPAYVRYFEGDLVDYNFEPTSPDAEVVLFNQLFAYDPARQRFFGYADEPGTYRVGFEVRDTTGALADSNGTVTIEIASNFERPNPQLQTPLAPIAFAGEVFELPIHFDQPGVSWELGETPEWLSQTDSKTLSGIAPFHEGRETFQLYAENALGWNQDYTLSIDITSAQTTPPANLKSPAAAIAYVDQPFEYFLEFDRYIEPQDLMLNYPDWLRFDSETRHLYGTPSHRGEDRVFVEMQTHYGGHSEAELTIQVSDENVSPVFIGQTPPPAFVGFPYSYQFRLEGSADQLYANVNDPLAIDWSTGILTASPLAADDAYFELDAVNAGHSATVDGTIRIVEAAPFFLRDPISMTSPQGGRAFFSAQFSGAPHTTRWLRDDSILVGSTKSLELETVRPQDQGAYWLYVENAIGDAWSQSAELTIGTPTRYRDWILSEQGSLALNDDRGNPSQSLAGDQAPNLIKWAMGLNIAQPISQSSVASLSQAEGIVFSFPVALSPQDVVFTVEHSGTLQSDSWKAIARRPAGGSWLTLDERFHLEEAMTNNTPKIRLHDLSEEANGFFRIRVNLTEASQSSIDF